MIHGDAGDACTVVLGYSISFAPLAIPLGIILVAFLAKRWGTLERGTPRKEFRTSLAVVIVLAGLTAGFMAEGVADYVQANGWKFQFQASFGLKGVGPSIVVVPEVADRSLLAHLRLWSGSANWSYVETPYGPGLYVVVREDLTILYADFLIYPPPAQLPDTSFTMTGSWGSSGSYAWIYFAGSSTTYGAVRSDNYTTNFFHPYEQIGMGTPLIAGWQQYPMAQHQMLP